MVVISAALSLARALTAASATLALRLTGPVTRDAPRVGGGSGGGVAITCSTRLELRIHRLGAAADGDLRQVMPSSRTRP